ncbi:MAG: GDP-mannose 4,6-dehydratase, partial [Alphaproteobacteria bacterium]|nr:GDP-mannose 4,6-dehydratase [Alphaproteobacteria bacterium]
ADDYIIATGKPHSVRSIVEHAAAALDFDLVWEGEGANTTGIDKKSGRLLVAIDTRFYRPTEPDPLIGDSRKIREALGWQPQVAFEELIAMMVAADKERLPHG